jgi:transcriptional regulator with XRE-family HTH domain
VTAGELIRERRLAHGLSQERLARRARTSQAAISRLERDEVSPTVQTLSEILLALGEEPDVAGRPIEGHHDRAHLADMQARPPGERVELAWSWNRFAGEVSRAGARARGEA